MANLITIDQLLESVDLDFEPRFVTKDKNGWISFFDCKPVKIIDKWLHTKPTDRAVDIFPIKLAEFAGKDWTECIYEVPRKTDEYEQNLEKLRPADSDLVYRVNLPRKTTGKIEKLLEQKLTIGKTKYEYPTHAMLMDKINELVDAVNELKGKMNVA